MPLKHRYDDTVHLILAPEEFLEAHRGVTLVLTHTLEHPKNTLRDPTHQVLTGGTCCHTMIHYTPLYEFTECLHISVQVGGKQLPQHGGLTFIFRGHQQLHKTISHLETLQCLHVGSLDSIHTPKLPERVEEVSCVVEERLSCFDCERVDLHPCNRFDWLKDTQPPLDQVVLNLTSIGGGVV